MPLSANLKQEKKGEYYCCDSNSRRLRRTQTPTKTHTEGDKKLLLDNDEFLPLISVIKCAGKKKPAQTESLQRFSTTIK